jgi:alpha-amylase/alpha-mannosidase (GH57 family)
MPQIHLCFLWHMHQPFYKDLVSGEYKLPWTRMHALKDYYGMVKILEEFPAVRQTFNLVPSMLVQVEEYARGDAADPFLEAALKPAEALSDGEKAFILKHSFYSDPQRMIYRYPRYGELYNAWQAQRGAASRTLFGPQEFRDLQMWSQLAWFDEEFQERDPEIHEWIRRGRNFTLADQARMGQKQREIINAVIPEYRKLATKGQIEISTTPFYHPILPLLCDTNVASMSHPNVALPPRFRYPQDARQQLVMAREFIQSRFGMAPTGLWPSEGSVSDEVFQIASELGFEWAATDSGVLNRTLGRNVDVTGLYRPYRWEQGGRAVSVIFRDHFLSDLLGFVYSKMDATAAANDFLRRLHENCAGILASGRDALVPIILDGENAWEYYDRNGRPFLRELYRGISNDKQMHAVTVREGLRLLEPERLSYIFPGSWIDANFDVWIGAEEDNQAWTQLLRARETFDSSAASVPQQQRDLAFQELLIAEGSDWNWWYGPEHDSANRAEFDQLYRSHLANVYRFLNIKPPEELSRPILRVAVKALEIPPSGPISPTIDGEITSYFEWMGAGVYRAEERSGAMHGKKFLIEEVQYGTDGVNLYVRIDFHTGFEHMSAMELRFTAQAGDKGEPARLTVSFTPSGASAQGLEGVECAFGRVLEMKLPLQAISAGPAVPVRFQLSVWETGLPMDAIPQQGWIELRPDTAG